MRFSHQNAGVSSDVIAKHAKTLSDYRARLAQVAASGTYEEPESSINLPADSELREEIKQTAAEHASARYIIVCGIGGSNLGTKAVYDALLGAFDVLSPERTPKMLFADTNDPEIMEQMRALVGDLASAEEVALVVISKSGSTTETIANAEYLVGALTDTFGEEAAHKCLTVITDEGSMLDAAAETRGIRRLAIPASVGGRFSVLSAVGLFPLALAGIDIEELCRGAREMREACLSEEPKENPALSAAVTLFEKVQAGFPIHNTFLFHPELESLGKWYRQLVGESLGKERNRENEVVHAGITPTISIGSTDLHSVGQLYLGGPRDKYTAFVATERMPSSPRVPNALALGELVQDISGKPLSEIMDAILRGVKTAYEGHHLPYAEITLSRIDEAEIGAFLQFKMMEVMYVGELMGINAFDQPNVESYKEATRKILKEN